MIKKTFALLALAVVTTTAQAGTSAPSGKGVIAPTIEPESSISYSNISLSKQYLFGKFDISALSEGPGSIDLDADGVALALEYSPVNNVYVALGGSYNDVSVSFFGNEASIADYWTANVGIGGYIPLTSNIHFVTELGANYASLDYSVPAPNISDESNWGFYAVPHIRASFGKFETHLGASYTSNDAAASEWSAFLRLIYAATPELDLFATGSLGLSDSTYLQDFRGVNFGIRYKF
jgi:hypothetical protein